MKKRHSRKNMPKPKAIFNFWKKKLFTEYGREIVNQGTCFACLREGYVQRCHINALAGGGSNGSDNLHLLCPNCHVESEGFEGRFYWTWFENKDLIFIPMYRNIERALLIGKFAAMLKQEMPKEYFKILKSDSTKDMVMLYDKFIKSKVSGYTEPKSDKNTLF